MNEQRIREIVASTWEENSGSPSFWSEVWEDAIEEAISTEVGQDVGGVLDGVVEEVDGQLPKPDWGFLEDLHGEEHDVAFHDYQRASHEERVAAIARAIMAKLRVAGFPLDPA